MADDLARNASRAGAKIANYIEMTRLIHNDEGKWVLGGRLQHFLNATL